MRFRRGRGAVRKGTRSDRALQRGDTRVGDGGEARCSENLAKLELGSGLDIAMGLTQELSNWSRWKFLRVDLGKAKCSSKGLMLVLMLADVGGLLVKGFRV